MITKNKENFKIQIELEIPFEKYESKAKNRQAKSQIKKWIKDVLKEYHIPLYIDKEVTGSFIEDSTEQIKVKKIYE